MRSSVHQVIQLYLACIFVVPCLAMRSDEILYEKSPLEVDVSGQIQKDLISDQEPQINNKIVPSIINPTSTTIQLDPNEPLDPEKPLKKFKSRKIVGVDRGNPRGSGPNRFYETAWSDGSKTLEPSSFLKSVNWF